MGNDTPSKVEFAVNIDTLDCVESVKRRLNEIGVKNSEIETLVDSGQKQF